MRWCWHPEAAVHAERGTGRGSAWPALHSAGAPAVAGADWPVRVFSDIKGALNASQAISRRQSSKIRNQ